MPVIAMWKCDRDGAMFENKKDADAHDKMLELGEYFTALIESQIGGVDEAKAESFGLLLAKNKDVLLQALKGKPELIESIGNPDNVTSITEATSS